MCHACVISQTRHHRADHLRAWKDYLRIEERLFTAWKDYLWVEKDDLRLWSNFCKIVNLFLITWHTCNQSMNKNMNDVRYRIYNFMIMILYTAGARAISLSLTNMARAMTNEIFNLLNTVTNRSDSLTSTNHKHSKHLHLYRNFFFKIRVFSPCCKQLVVPAVSGRTPLIHAPIGRYAKTTPVSSFLNLKSSFATGKNLKIYILTKTQANTVNTYF